MAKVIAKGDKLDEEIVDQNDYTIIYVLGKHVTLIIVLKKKSCYSLKL